MSTDAKVRFIWEERKIDITTDEHILGFKDSPFNVAKISPSINNMSYFYFDFIRLIDSTLIVLNPTPKTFKLRKSSIYTITVVEPTPMPIKSDWNERLVDEEDTCRGHLYFFDPRNKMQIESVRFLKSLSSSWEDVPSAIEKALTESNLGTFGISVGFLTEDSGFPEMIPMHVAFRDLKYGQRALIVFVSSFKDFTLTIGNKVVSSKKVPEIPRRLINLVSNSGNISDSNCSAVRRRILTCLFNGGIPSDLFDKEDLEQQPTLKTSDFDFVKLGLLFQERGRGLTLSESRGNLALNIQYFETVFLPINEASLRSFFWDALIFELIYGIDKEETFTNFVLLSEWRTRDLFPQLESRRIDLVSLVKVGEKAFPILQIEIGTEAFSLANPHKDLSKLLATMSLTCIEMALKMAKSNKRAEDARVYGIWIGGSKFQFCVAHPVIKKLGDNNYDIHSILTFKNEWLFDMLATASSLPKAFVIGTPNESIVKTKSELNNLLFSKDFQQQLRSQADIVLLENVEIARESNTPLFVPGQLNSDSLLILRNFLEIVYSRILTIHASQASEDEENRVYKSKTDFGMISKSRSGSSKETPVKQKSNFDKVPQNSSPQDPTKSPLGRMTRSFSQTELDILVKLAKFRSLFPELYYFNIKETETGKVVEYYFEWLEELKDQYGCISDKIDCGDDDEGVIMYALLFGVQTLYGLYVLHEEVGVIHSDISPGNIMYSEKYKTWKLNDYDQSLEIEKSLITLRFGGTQGYTAPEISDPGIFTKASDIFSLGQVMVDCVNAVILARVFKLKDLEERFQPDPHLSVFGQKIIRVVYSMTSLDPKARRTAVEVLESFLNIYDEFIQFSRIQYDDGIIREAKIMMLAHKYKKLEVKDSAPSDFEIETSASIASTSSPSSQRT